MMKKKMKKINIESVSKREFRSEFVFEKSWDAVDAVDDIIKRLGFSDTFIHGLRKSVTFCELEPKIGISKITDKVYGIGNDDYAVDVFIGKRKLILVVRSLVDRQREISEAVFGLGDFGKNLDKPKENLEKMDTRIILNEKIFLEKDTSRFFGMNIFDLMKGKVTKFIMNNSGDKFSDDLKKFDSSGDKVFGHEWSFIVDDNSRSLIRKVMKYYYESRSAHWSWKLVGDDFLITFEECGDAVDHPNNYKRGLSKKYKFRAKGKMLEKINKFLGSLK